MFSQLNFRKSNLPIFTIITHIPYQAVKNVRFEIEYRKKETRRKLLYNLKVSFHLV